MLSGTSIQVGANNTLTQANAYNGSGQRIAKDENGTLTNYFYQGSSVLYTTDSADAKTSQNFLSPVGSAIATARYAPTDISYYLYNKDIRNSSVSILNETAGFATKYSYDEFGITSVDGSYTFANEICYTGGIYDWASGQYYLNARYYDPQLGRFLSEDTYRGETNDPNSWHLYAYCANNPINYVDPSGHNRFQVLLGVMKVYDRKIAYSASINLFWSVCLGKIMGNSFSAWGWGNMTSWDPFVQYKYERAIVLKNEISLTYNRQRALLRIRFNFRKWTVSPLIFLSTLRPGTSTFYITLELYYYADGGVDWVSTGNMDGVLRGYTRDINNSGAYTR